MAVITGLAPAEKKPSGQHVAPLATPPANIDPILIDSWLQATEELELAELKLDALKAKFVSEVPEQPGDHEIIVGDHRVVVKHTERWDWDQDVLNRLFDAGQVPDHIQRRLRVDRKTFEKLEPSEQQILQPALTKKIGSTRVKVEKI